MSKPNQKQKEKEWRRIQQELKAKVKQKREPKPFIPGASLTIDQGKKSSLNAT